MVFWQQIGAFSCGSGPFREAYPAALPEGETMDLPLRDLSGFAVAGFVANQASFSVVRRLAGWMTELARPWRAEIVVGLPTLGQVFAPLVAEALGHPNWVAPGWSRKRWYEEELSVPVRSITSPGERRLWLDPRLVSRMAGRRVLLVDDVISTGASALAGLTLLRAAGVEPVAMVVAMAQGDRWRPAWPGLPLHAVFATPILMPGQGGWLPAPGTAALDLCPLLAKDHAA